MTIQEEFWRGDFGNQYVARNRLRWQLRVPFWDDVVNWVKPTSILEVGCNIGSNLKAIRSIDPTIDLWGCDINQAALQEAADSGLQVRDASVFDLQREWPAGTFDLVCTVGMLIHISPDDLPRAMDSIIAASKRYVLAVEYAADKEEHVEYRGYTDRLWRRPFGKLYEDRGLVLIDQWDAGNGFDRCTSWLMRAP